MYTARGSQSAVMQNDQFERLLAKSNDLYDLMLMQLYQALYPNGFNEPPVLDPQFVFGFQVRKLWSFESYPSFSLYLTSTAAFTSFPVLTFYANRPIDFIGVYNCAIQMNDSSDTAKINELVTALQAVFPDANYVVPS